MKKIFPVLLSLVLLLSACRDISPAVGSAHPSAPPPALTAAQVLDAMLDACPEVREDAPERLEEPELSTQVQGFYGLDEGAWDDAAVAVLGGSRAFELAVVCLAPGAGEDDAQEKLQAYLLSRQGDFTGYAPDQAALAENALVFASGRYLGLAICEDPEGAADAFTACLGGGSAVLAPVASDPAPSIPDGRYPYTDPELDDMTLYDTSAILCAWESGDRAALSEKDTAILEAAEAVLDEMLTDGMSDYEKEVALYLWVVYHVDYDWAHNDSRKKMDPDSPNPYGALVNRKAICVGFATTVQLLMDMAGVECVTVVGAAFRSTEDHAWNMVRLNGDWYCVDATWDMGTGYLTVQNGMPQVMDLMDAWKQGGFEPRWTYFNATSDWMAESDHQWDYATVPEATAGNRGKG